MRSPCFALAVFFVILSLFLLSLLLKYLVNKRTSQLLKLIDEKKELLRREKENFKRIETLQKVGIVGLMSSMFAHEVRQPLSTISCWGHVLKKLAGQSENSKEMVPLIEKMVSAASRQRKKLPIFEACSELRSRSWKKIDLTEIISEELKSLHQTLEKKIRVEFKEAATRPYVLMARTELEVSCSQHFSKIPSKRRKSLPKSFSLLHWEQKTTEFLSISGRRTEGHSRANR